MCDLVKIVETQSQIIRLQSEAINDLFKLLAQHVSADELDRHPSVENINLAAALRAEIE